MAYEYAIETKMLKKIYGGCLFKSTRRKTWNCIFPVP